MEEKVFGYTDLPVFMDSIQDLAKWAEENMVAIKKPEENLKKFVCLPEFIKSSLFQL